MPYGVKQTEGGKWVVYNKETGHVYGTHATKKDALAQLAAIEVNTKGRSLGISFLGDREDGRPDYWDDE